MMIEKYVFTEGRAQDLYDEEQMLVNTVYDFGDVGSIVKVNYDDKEDIETVKQNIDTVVSVEDGVNEGFITRVAPNSIADRVATMEEVKRLHNIRERGYTGEGIHVVVMDSGIDVDHPLFADMDITQVDVTGSGEGDAVGHGTAVAGQIVQIAPDVKLTALRIFGQEGRASYDTILSAYEWLFNHADEIDVVNMSWGTSRKVQQLDDLQNKLVNKGVRDVTAAGNTSEEGGSPATAEKAFSAGATNENGEMASFSSYNPNWDNPDVSAIGVNNRLAQASGTSMGSDLDGDWVMASGTSFAAPELAGSVARYLEGLEAEGLEGEYETNTNDIKGTERDGFGMLSHNDTVESPIEETTADVWTMWEDGKDVMYLNKNWFSDGKYSVAKVDESDDRTVLEFTKE